MGLNYCRKSNGFSLLEVVVAVAILSIGITVVLQALSYSARVTGISCDMVKAAFLAEDKLQELELKEKYGLITENQTAQDLQDKFRWDYTFSLNQDLKLYRLDFSINWQRLNRQEGFDITSYFRE